MYLHRRVMQGLKKSRSVTIINRRKKKYEFLREKKYLQMIWKELIEHKPWSYTNSLPLLEADKISCLRLNEFFKKRKEIP